MAEKLMHDSHAAEELRMLLEAAADATTPAEAPKAKEAPKKDERGLGKRIADKILPPNKPAGAIESAIAAPITATVESVKSGGQHIANAIVPPTPEHDQGVLSRVGEGGLGALEMLMARYGVPAGGAVLKHLTEMAVGADSKAPLPEALRNVYMAADVLFRLPNQLLDPKERADWNKDPVAYATKTLKNTEEPTYGDLASFLGSIGGAHVVGKMGGGKGSPVRKSSAAETAKTAAEAKLKASQGNGAPPAPGESAADVMGGTPTAESLKAADAASLEQVRRNGELLGTEDQTVAPLPEVAATEGMSGDAAEAQINGQLGIGGEKATAGPEAPASPEGAPGRVEPAAAAEAVPGAAGAPTEPLADPMQGTEGFIPQRGPETPLVPDPFLEGTEAAGAVAPAPKTIPEIHSLVQPAVDTAAKAVQDSVAREQQVRNEAAANAAAMRAQGATRQEINDAFRARLNEAGIKSKNQQRADAWVEAHLADRTSLARRMTSEIMKNSADPETAVRDALKKLGVPDEQAGQIAATAVDALRKVGMDDGAGGVALGHPEGAVPAPFDAKAAETALSERLKGLCP